MSHFNRNEIRRNGGDRNWSDSPANRRNQTRYNDNFQHGTNNRDYNGSGRRQEFRNEMQDDDILWHNRYTGAQAGNFPLSFNRQIYETPNNNFRQNLQSGGFGSGYPSPGNYHINYESQFDNYDQNIGQYNNTGRYQNFQFMEGNNESPFNTFNERFTRPPYNSTLNPYASPYTPNMSRIQPSERQENTISREQVVPEFNNSQIGISTNSTPSIRHGPLVPPIQQMNTPGKAEQNPFIRNQDFAVHSSNVSSTNSFSQEVGTQNRIPQTANSNLEQNPHNSQPSISKSLPPLNDNERSIEQSYRDKIREISNKLNNWVRISKKEYPVLAKDYMSWRTLYLMQAQVHGMHEIFEANYVPKHIKYSLPPAGDPCHLGRPELFLAAQELHNAIFAADNAMFFHQASFLTAAIEHNEIAKSFIRHNDVNPIQIFHDLDEAFIEQNPLTKGEFISTIWNLRPRSGEKLSGFFARLDIERSTLMNMFKHQLSDDDIFSIIQQSIPKEFMYTYMEMQNQKKSLAEVRKAMIALEIAMNRRTSAKRQDLANSANKFIHRNFDRQHNRIDSPQRGHYRYRDSDNRKSTSPRGTYQRSGNAWITRSGSDSGNIGSFQRNITDKSHATRFRTIAGPFAFSIAQWISWKK